MSSYHIKNGEKKIFQFFENRYWDDDQDYLANDYFIFKVKENDLFALGYIYWAHIAIWLSGSANMVTKAEFIIDSFQEAICKELRDRKIENDPPNFGYNHTNLDVLAISWCKYP